ncbi:MAG: peroxidase, partial [Verrucomicrobiota bacterium]|nr:peroxidase [Verrucomicrobiota bacterium]
MIDPNETQGTDTIPAGYTYFGQFVDHDLTHDTTRLEDSSPDVASISNGRTPHLNLEHLYRGGPRVMAELYETGADPVSAKFRIDLTEAALPGPPPARLLDG